MKQNIQIDREFMNLTVPNSEDDQEKLEASLLHEGCLEPVIVWRGVILDGHKRYKFCGYEDIEYEVREMDFPSREEAVVWVCRQRVPALTAHQPMYRYLVGKWYICQKKLNRQRRKQGEEPVLDLSTVRDKRRTSVWDTSSRMSDELGICHSTVEEAGVFASAMDRISDIEPAMFEAILRREVHFKNSEIKQMAKMDEKQLGEIKRKKLGKKDVKMRRRNKMDNWDKHRGEEQMENETTPIITGIKDTPAFDPDMEIRGLAFTIPTWINAIARVEKKMDADKASDKAKEQLTANLTRLQEQINRMLEVLQ